MYYKIDKFCDGSIGEVGERIRHGKPGPSDK